MALIQCPECGKKVSDKAKECPECGHPIAEVTAEKKVVIKNEEGCFLQTLNVGCALVALVIIVIVLLLIFT